MNPDHYYRHGGGGGGRCEYDDDDDGAMYEPYGGNRYDDDRGGGGRQLQGNSLPSLSAPPRRNNYHQHQHQQNHHRQPNPHLHPHPHHQPSALEGCMSERRSHQQQQQNDRRFYSTTMDDNIDSDDNDRKPGAFHDTAYDDMLERKRAAYAPPATPRARNAANDTMIELGPGVYARLRGASETWACIEVDFHVPVTCCACALELCCIQDADYVLCPRCKVVSPLEGAVPSDTYARNDDSGGVGLGFTFDELFKWQAEIMNRRNQQRLQQNNHAATVTPPPPAVEAYY